MIHIVHVLTRTNVGGPSVMLVDLIEGLDRQQFRHTIIRGPGITSEGDYLVQRPVNADVITLGGLHRSLGVVRELQSVWTLTRALRRLAPDVVHTHMAKAGVVGRVAAILARVPIRIHTFHGHLLHGYFSAPLTKLFATVERVLRRFTTFSLVVGEATRRDLLAAHIVTSARSAVLYPGVRNFTPAPKTDSRIHLGLPTDGLVVGFVGRLTDVKRPDRFIDLARAIPDTHFALIGNGPLQATLHAQAAVLSNMTLVDFTADLSVVFGALDLVVLTSDNEGVPLSLMEAASAGVPVVALRVGGVSEIVEHEVTGLLVDHDADLLGSVQRVLNDSQLRTRLSSQANRHIQQRCSMTTYLEQHTRLYQEQVQR